MHMQRELAEVHRYEIERKAGFSALTAIVPSRAIWFVLRKEDRQLFHTHLQCTQASFKAHL